jgi:tryptophan synthase beta chain
MGTEAGQTGEAKLQDFHAELERLLLKQLEAQPRLDDVRVKLLELYFETHRKDDFVKAARAFHRLLDKAAAGSRDWQRVASMGRMLAAGEALFSGQSSDRIEFVDVAGAAMPEQPRVQRFGDELRLRPRFDDLARQYTEARKDPRFLAELELLLVALPTRRPTPLTHARRLSEHLGGAQLYFKREDLADENPHLTIAIAGQALFARRLGRKTLVTGTADGRRGVIAAQVAARLGLRALVYMDAGQAERAAANTLFMQLLGAGLEVVKVAHFKNRDVREAALEYWDQHPEEAFLLTGLDAAPPPYPVMTQEFTAAIGRELRRQMSGPGKALPAMVVTRGSSTADALGVFPAFLADKDTQLVCVEPEKEPEDDPRKAGDPFTQVGMPMSTSEKKVAQGILDRLEYPSVAREHAWLRASGRVAYVETPRAAAREALQTVARLEGVIAPIGSAHALAWACGAARRLTPQQSLVVVMAEHAAASVWDIRRLLEEGAPARDPGVKPAPARK